MALLLALSLVVAPHAHAYDAVLLAPLMFVALDLLAGRPVALALAGIGAVAISWWIALVVVVDWGSLSAFALVPIGMLLAVSLLALLGAPRPANARHSDDDHDADQEGQGRDIPAQRQERLQRESAFRS